MGYFRVEWPVILGPLAFQGAVIPQMVGPLLQGRPHIGPPNHRNSHIDSQSRNHKYLIFGTFDPSGGGQRPGGLLTSNPSPGMPFKTTNEPEPTLSLPYTVVSLGVLLCLYINP